MNIIEHVSIDGPRMRVRPARRLRPFMPSDFEASYSPAVDLAEVPPQIRLLPFLWNVAPIVWATGLELSVDVLDTNVVQSFDAVRDALRAMYPSIPWHGAIQPEKVVDTPAPEPTDFTAAALFSGGVDSIWTALRHGGDGLLLVSVWGTDTPLDAEDAWARIVARNQTFAANHAGGLAVVRSNFKQLDYPRLRVTTGIPRWWAHVQHAMALAGLTAPLLYQRGVPLLHIASTYTSSFEASWGSDPRLDTLVSLGTASVHHDSYELSRQDKVQRIVSFYRDQAQSPPVLRVCNDASRSGGGNCEQCEKCVRSIVSVLIAGGDPTAYGFPRFQPSLLDELPARFREFSYQFSEDQVFMWRDMQAHLPPKQLTSAPFWSWLSTYDFEKYRAAQPTVRKAIPTGMRGFGARMPRLYFLARNAQRRLTGK